MPKSKALIIELRAQIESLFKEGYFTHKLPASWIFAGWKHLIFECKINRLKTALELTAEQNSSVSIWAKTTRTKEKRTI